MNLEQNLIDNILECEIKLGHENLPIRFYYPISSLLELLKCTKLDLYQKMQEFQEKEAERLGKVTFKEKASEKGRFQVTVPVEGVEWVSKNYKPSPFMQDFVAAIHTSGNKVQDIIALFERYADDVIIQQENEQEWAISFANTSIDPYVYHIEEGEFGLQYHRFTKQSYVETIK